MNNDQVTPLNVGSQPLTKEERRKLKKQKDEDPNRPWEFRDLNIWRSNRQGYRMVAAWIGLTACSIWLYYFGYNMNLIPTDCWYIVAQLKADTTQTKVVLNNRNATGLGTKYSIQESVNVSYDFRLICVLGVTCFSLLGFISCAQVLKPLYILIAMVMPYTVTATVWWYVWSYRKIYSTAAAACSDYQMLQPDPADSTPPFNTTEIDMLFQQGKFMTRWFVAFSIIAGIFLLVCLPFSSFFLYERIDRDCKKRRKENKKREAKREKFEKMMAVREARRQQRAAEAGNLEIPLNPQVQFGSTDQGTEDQ